MSTTDRQTSEDSILPREGSYHPLADLTGVVLGDFQVDRLLGRGGMGEVYLATQLSLNRPVALKVLRPDFASNPTYLGRLRTEATAVAKLNHPNIVQVYTLGFSDDVHFIAMEYVQGTNLKDYLVKKGGLDLPLAYSIMKQTAQAVGAAGEVGLIHRDVKPENILITKKGRVKVADFGLCRDQAGEPGHLTQSGVTMGTPLYMSPEQAQGHAVDHRSDLYSLGVTYYHMLTGVPPFRAETALALALKHVRENPRSMLVHRAELPPELDRLVLKLMAKPPVDRYQSAAEMLADLAKLRESLQIGSAATIADPGQDAPARAGDSAAVGDARPESQPALSRPSGVSLAERPAVQAIAAGALARVSWPLTLATSAVCLLGGAFAGWSARQPDVMAVPTDALASQPALWLQPRWRTIPKQDSAPEQLHYALIEAPREEWASACLAVPGYFPHSHDQASKAYTQLARILYRRRDVDSLAALESELGRWKDAKKHDQELADVVRIAIKLTKADFEGVVEGFRNLTRDETADMYDAALVQLSLEICGDAMQAATRAGTESIVRETLQGFHMNLMLRLYRIEVPKANRPLARAAGKRA
jgi:eukaryotic-like serine/threonine-protein kinase